MAQIKSRHELGNLFGAKVWFVRQVSCIVSGKTVNTSLSTVVAWEVGNTFGHVDGNHFKPATRSTVLKPGLHNLHHGDDWLSDSDPRALNVSDYFDHRDDGRHQGVFTTVEEAEDLQVYIALCGSGHLDHAMIKTEEAQRQAGLARVLSLT